MSGLEKVTYTGITCFGILMVKYTAGRATGTHKTVKYTAGRATDTHKTVKYTAGRTTGTHKTVKYTVEAGLAVGLSSKRLSCTCSCMRTT